MTMKRPCACSSLIPKWILLQLRRCRCRCRCSIPQLIIVWSLFNLLLTTFLVEYLSSHETHIRGHVQREVRQEMSAVERSLGRVVLKAADMAERELLGLRAVGERLSFENTSTDPTSSNGVEGVKGHTHLRAAAFNNTSLLSQHRETRTKDQNQNTVDLPIDNARRKDRKSQPVQFQIPTKPLPKYDDENAPTDMLTKSCTMEGLRQMNKKIEDAPPKDTSSIHPYSRLVDKDAHPIAGLNCQPHGEPTDRTATEDIIWWRDMPSDSTHRSPFVAPGEEPQYLTFEPDFAGFNNGRMIFETIFVIAAATGRTLVLPPLNYKINHLEKDSSDVFRWDNFFPLRSIAEEYAGVEIISMEEFLLREGTNLRDRDSGERVLPPGNKFDWSSSPGAAEASCLWQYLRSVSVVPEWSVRQCLLAIPKTRSVQDIEELKGMEYELNQTIMSDWNAELFHFRKYVNNPPPVDASPGDRLEYIRLNRRRLCIYDQELQAAPLIHISWRLIAHFYSFVFFQDWKMDLFYKRLIRDHIRYTDDIMCAAARVINALRERIRVEEKGNPEGNFDSLHIRRGDFQVVYKNYVGQFGAEDFYKHSAEHLTQASTIYIATDERDKSFFHIFRQHYRVFFLDDFKDLLKDVDKMYYGHVDQIIAAKGATFFGCKDSTFTGYINRLRGYYSTKFKLPGHEQGILDSYLFAAEEWHRIDHRENRPLKSPVWTRDYPLSWRDIDKGVE